MTKILLPLIASAALHAGLTDFRVLDQAAHAYNEGNFTEAANRFASVADKNDEARFDYATALYKAKQYKAAIETYGKIPGTSALKAKSLYNMGNAHARLGELDPAEKAYTDALKIVKDEPLKQDIEYNLDVIRKAKKQQQEQQKKQQDKKDQNKKEDQKQQNQNNEQQNGQDQNGSSQQEQQQKSQEAKNQNGKSDKPREGENTPQDSRGENDRQQEGEEKPQTSPEKAEEKAPEEKQEGKNSAERNEKQDAQQAQAAKAAPISDMEERKYNQMLDKRGIKTLMIPLSGKGEPRENETTPW